MSLRKEPDTVLRGVRTNIVQSIRAYRVQDLQEAADTLGQHFLYANVTQAQNRQEVLDLIGTQFTFTPQLGKNFDVLYNCMTDSMHKCGQQQGFVVVLEHLPATAKFDKEMREQLLDVFRDTAEYWSERKIAFRCFYSFSVARCATTGQAQRTSRATIGALSPAIEINTGTTLCVDENADVSPLALRMSNPFNAGYWLTVA